MRICNFQWVGVLLTPLVSTAMVTTGLAPRVEPLVAHEMPGMSHGPGKPQHGSGEHRHGQVTIPPGQPVPSVKLVAHPDAMRGWNLEVRVSNFVFAPERVNTKGITSEGHAHLYLDGKKLTRLYSSWY